jgi:hypothetical protein
MNESDIALLKLERLRRQINREARASVLWIVAAIGAAFVLGYLLGRWR